MKTWTASEVDRFLKAVRGHGLHPLFRLALYSGMRRGELLGLRWRDIDLPGGYLSVRQQLTRIEHEIGGRKVKVWGIRPTPKTAAGRRRIDLDDETIAILREHRTKQTAERHALGEQYQDTNLVFVRKDGT
jgi:integrase